MPTSYSDFSKDIALVASTYEPKYRVWESLKAIEVDEDTKFVAEDRYFNLNMGSSVAAAVNLFFEKCIRGSTDKTTIVKKIAFQYVLRDKSEVPYITLVVMTNRGLVGNKYDPFIFQFVLPAGKLLGSNIGNTTKCEGVWHLKPEYDSISDACSVKRKIQYVENIDLRNNIVETLISHYQLENPIEDEAEDGLILGGDGALVNTYAIAELGAPKKESLHLVKILTTGFQNVSLEVYKQLGKGRKMWRRKEYTIVKKSKPELCVTAVPVKVEQDTLILAHTLKYC